jgi:hypothetical protein
MAFTLRVVESAQTLEKPVAAKRFGNRICLPFRNRSRWPSFCCSFAFDNVHRIHVALTHREFAT